jgi:uncharacterized membrane protein YsdA (DUF1294 family)
LIRLFLLSVAVVFVCLSVITFLFYAFDKLAAKQNARRIPEKLLHVLAMLGGWPGALLGQKVMRHKTAKPAFARVFWLTVLFNLAAVAAAASLVVYLAQDL